MFLNFILLNNKFNFLEIIMCFKLKKLFIKIKLFLLKKIKFTKKIRLNIN